MMKRAVIGVLALAVAATVSAQDLRIPPGKWWENPRLVERLRLTPEQQETIRDLVLEHARRMIDLNADVKRAELDLAERVDREPLDPKAVRAAFAVLQTARQRLEAERFELLLGVRQAVTPEQWDELERIRRDLRERLEQRPPGGRPGAPLDGAPPRRRP
jgi:Spy/CpxP family protein refolding chaperone